MLPAWLRSALHSLNCQSLSATFSQVQPNGDGTLWRSRLSKSGRGGWNHQMVDAQVRRHYCRCPTRRPCSSCLVRARLAALSPSQPLLRPRKTSTHASALCPPGRSARQHDLAGKRYRAWAASCCRHWRGRDPRSLKLPDFAPEDSLTILNYSRRLSYRTESFISMHLQYQHISCCCCVHCLQR